MKRRIAAAVVTLLIGVGISMPVRAQAQDAGKPVAYGFAYNKIQFEKVSVEDIPSSLSDIINPNKEKQGYAYYYDTNTGYMYIAVLMGEKNTGGYSIDVTGVEDSEGRTGVFVSENAPAPDSMVPEIVTYPYVVIRAKGITANITIKSSSGTTYAKLDAGSNAEKLSYTLVTEDILKDSAPKIADEIKSLKECRGYYTFEGSKWGIEDSASYVLIGSGMKPTLGYGIDVLSAEKKDNVNTITVRESSPEPDTLVGQIVTWPFLILKVEGLAGNINVVTEQGDKFSSLNLDEDATEIEDAGFSMIKGYDSVAPDKVWTITFNTEVSKENVNDSNIYVRDSSGKKVSVDLRLLDNKKQITAVPKSNYMGKGTYYLFIMKSIGSSNLKADETKGYRMKFVIE